MEDEKPVLEQMTDMMAEAAHVTKRLPKKGREEGQKGRQESYAEEVREEKGRENDYEEKEELETLNRLSSYCNYAVSTGCTVGRHMLWNAKIKPEGFCAVRPSSSASLHRIIWGTKIPLDTPLARLVMADPAIGVIERDIALPHIIAPV